MAWLIMLYEKEEERERVRKTKEKVGAESCIMHPQLA